MDPRYDYCKVYINGPLDRKALQALLAQILQAQLGAVFMVEAPDVVVDVRSNDYYDESRSDHYVYWPFYLDVERQDSAEDLAVRDSVATILNGLWQGDIDAVAACAFKEELPRAGGWS